MENSNKELFETMPVPRAVATMAVPTIMGQLIVLIYNMADTFFLGKTNSPEMVAAASLVLPVFNISLSLAGLAGVGGGALVSRLLGENELTEAKKAGSFSIWFSALVAGVFSLCTFLFMRPLLNLLGADAGTYDYARRYALCVIVLGGIPTVLSNTLAALLRSIGESKKAGFGIMAGGIINMLLDPLFMFVIFPKGQEILGAGVATAISNYLSCLYFIFTIRMLGKNSVLGLLSPTELPEKRSIRSIFSVGIPSSISILLFDLDYVILDKLMSGYGNIPLAAIGIVLKVERLPLNTGVGLCQGMIPIVAYNFSAKNYSRLRSIRSFCRKAGLIFALFSVAMYECFANPILRAFIGEPETALLGARFLRVRCLATPLMFLSFYHADLFNAFGEGRKALFLGIARWAVFNIPMLFLLHALFGMQGLVWSQFAADILTVTLSISLYTRYENNLQ